jgi:hypothetical protein
MKKRTKLKYPVPHKTPAFISYSSADRAFGAQAKNVLESFGFETFLAHEDLEISAEWRDRIVEELRRCALFVPLLSKQFLESKWAAQEVGFIVALPEVVIAPLSLDGTIPFGFISHLQSRRVPADGITADVLVEPLARKLPRQILPILIYRAGEAGDFRSAEAHMQSLLPLFKLFTPQEAQSLAAASVENGQIWFAQKCREDFLPEFLRIQGSYIEAETLRALEYQLEHAEWYSNTAKS